MPVTHAQNATGPCLGSSRAPSTEPAAHGKSVVDRPSHVEHAAALAGRLQAEVALVHQRAHECSAESCRAEQRRAAQSSSQSAAQASGSMQGKAHLRCRASATCAMPARRTGPSCARHSGAVAVPLAVSRGLLHASGTPQARRSEQFGAAVESKRGGPQAAAAVSSSALAQSRARTGCGSGGCRCWWGVSPVLVQIWQGCAGVGACTSTHPVRNPVRRCGGDRLSALSCCRSTCACARACGCAVASAGARRATALARACHGPHSKMPLRDSPLTSARTRARAHSCYRKRRSVA